MCLLGGAGVLAMCFREPNQAEEHSNRYIDHFILLCIYIHSKFYLKRNNYCTLKLQYFHFYNYFSFFNHFSKFNARKVFFVHILYYCNVFNIQGVSILSHAYKVFRSNGGCNFAVYWHNSFRCVAVRT